MAVQQQVLTGTFVLGVYRGVTEEQFPKLQVATFVRDDGSEYVERLDFSPFNQRTGASTLPEGLEPGLQVAVRIRLDTRGYRDKQTGEPKSFVSKRAMEVIVL
jgi:hypothetical protein